MYTSSQLPSFKLLAAVCASLLTATACAQAPSAAYVPQSRGTTVTPPTNQAPAGTAVTSVRLTSSAAVSQSSVATTFGQAFAPGDVPKGQTLFGRSSSGNAVPLQVDAKARHADGSLRHAVITAQLPSLAAKQTETVNLVRGDESTGTAAASASTLLNSGFTASFNATIGGVRYTASADALLRAGKFTVWLAGPLATEWIVSAPLKTAAGVEHPHLAAHFAIRFYPGSNRARVDVAIENGWAYEAAPQNVTYDAQMLVGSKAVYAQSALNHYHHARWRKVFWWGDTPMVNVQHNVAYLIGSRALPNLDQSLVVKDATIASWSTKWLQAGKTGPMQTGVGQPYMPATGARSDIGLLPAWSALYILSQDQRMKDISLGMSDQAGSWSSHFRNKTTGRPVTLAEYPYISQFNLDTLNPATKLRETMPTCVKAACTTPLSADTSHQAAFSYIPYLVTGDYYHLEELQFWANFSSFSSNPGYRQGGKGLVKSDQVRGQAWTLRTLAEAAYITPDNDPQKANFTAILNHNIDWYDANYTNNSAANKLGVLEHGYAIVYGDNIGLAPWQDDFFTSSIGRMVELGFTRAKPLLTWKSKFVVQRMVGDGYCWIEAPSYSLQVRDSKTAPVYTTMRQVYQTNFGTALGKFACASAEMGAALKLRAGAMVGYVTANSSQSIMRASLAYSTPVNAQGPAAWALYAKRPFQPDYAKEPQFAILPR